MSKHKLILSIFFITLFLLSSAASATSVEVTYSGGWATYMHPTYSGTFPTVSYDHDFSTALYGGDTATTLFPHPPNPGNIIGYDIGTARAVNNYTVAARNDAPAFGPTSWNVSGSNDNSTWTEIAVNTTAIWTPNKYEIFRSSNTNAYRYYRMYVLDVDNASASDLAVLLGEWNLYYDAPPPVASFTTNATTGVDPTAIQFTDTSTNTPTSWQWGFKNVTGNNSWINGPTTQNPVQVFGYGNYTINLTATNAVGSNTSTQITWVNITQIPDIVASFSSKNVSIASNTTDYGWEGLAPFTMSFNDTSVGTPTSWVWNYTTLGNGPVTFNSSSFKNIQYTFVSPGNYSINLNATSIHSSNISTQITWVNVTTPQPTSFFTANVSSGYIPLPVLFTDESPGYPDTWNWSVEDSGPLLTWYNYTAAEHNLTYTFNTVGSWRVNLSVQNISTSTDISTSSMNITTTNVPPVASFDGTPLSGTTSTVFVFNDTSTGVIAAWNWSFGDGNYADTRNTTHTYAANAVYTINLTVSNDGGYSSAEHQFTVSPFSVSTTISPTTGVVPLYVVFNETYTGLIPDSYYWDFGDGVTSTSKNTTHTYTTTGVFSVNHSATNGTITVWSNTSNAVHASLGTISASFTASNSTFTSIPAVTRFTDTSTTVNLTINTHSWNFGDGYTSTDQSPLHIYNSFGVFNATLTASNTSEGISSVAYTTIAVTSLYPRNTSYNFIMLQEFPLTIRIKDAVTLSLIDDVDVTTDESTKSVATNGIYSETLSYGSHTFKFEKDGYSTTTTSLFVASNATYTVTMSPLSGVGSQNLNVLYPHETTFTITDLYGNRLQNISVTAQMTGTPIPGNWWNTLYGISTSISPVFNSTTMVSVTDDYGKVAFPMVSSATYALTFTGSQFSGGYITKQVTADQLAITLMLPTTTSQMPTFKSTMINATLYANSTLDPTIYLTLAYNDTSMTTTRITFFVDFPNRTRLYQLISPATPSTNQTFTTSYAVANVKDNAYVWGYISNSTFGNSTKAQGITLNGPSGSMIDIMTYHSGWD